MITHATPTRPHPRVVHSPLEASRIWAEEDAARAKPELGWRDRMVRDTLTARAADGGDTAMITAPAPLDVEIATRSQAAVDAALTALRARPPTQCDRCGNRSFYPAPIADGWWRCRTCHGGTFRGHPTAAEEAEATRTARETTTTAVLAEGDARLRHQISIDRRRDRRAMTPALARGMRDALLHRADPRYPATAAAAEFLDHCPLVDLLRKHLALALCDAGWPVDGRSSRDRVPRQHRLRWQTQRTLARRWLCGELEDRSPCPLASCVTCSVSMPMPSRRRCVGAHLLRGELDPQVVPTSDQRHRGPHVLPATGEDDLAVAGEEGGSVDQVLACLAGDVHTGEAVSLPVGIARRH
jgi:hypothetical protein